MSRFGAVATGHPATTAAAAEILEDGGNAFDAVVAGVFAAFTAEPVLASLGGGGFLMARPEGASPRLYDFFVQTPRRKRREDELDFRPILADFGPETQEFHIGLGAAATPGTARGLFAVHRDLCRLPMTRIVEPGVRLAAEGCVVNELQAEILRIVHPILLACPAGRAVFAGDGGSGGTRKPGERLAWPGLADVLDSLAREGDRLFYEGEIGRAIAAAAESGGGQITPDDLKHYEVAVRRPLERAFSGVRVALNPPPCAGGLLIALGLSLLDPGELRQIGAGRPGHAERLVRAMRLVNRLRGQIQFADDPDIADRLLDPKLLAAYRAEVSGLAPASRGTTHISAIDARGNAAALTLTNGEGCGRMAANDGFMLNNMLGEADLNPAGHHSWPADTRLSSMMAPTLMLWPDGAATALGSGGSNRIRSAMLQVIANLAGFGMSVADAVDAPRLHLEDGLLSIEGGFAEETAKAAAALMPDCRTWPDRSLFFGGVHTVHARVNGSLTAYGDPRRGGAAAVL
jgi:gamma-glutamyltranspeptidase/glutathione hydrolase